MDLSRLAVQLILAIVCAGVANMLLPRQIPGKFLGLIATGLVGVWVGEFGAALLKSQGGMDFAILHWGIQGVPILSSVIGSAIVIFLTTTFLKSGR
jgi:uncharacterized membrane protein YeaQ/YmgE (transglycosylase-associated protein family)